MRPARGWWVSFTVTFIGVTLLQLAWALVVPPFRGSDEHDHAYRASAVADGEWKPEYVAPEHGRGDLLTVRTDIVLAARPSCASLVYTRHDDCNPVSQVDARHVKVASAAARYNPAFYWVIGTAARPWEGAHALYVMRVAAAGMCALLIALSLTIASQWFTSSWTRIGVLSTLTPVMTYTTAMAAPNGLEMSGALLLWTALLALPSAAEHSRRSGRRLVACATTGAVVLATVRSLGPLWLVLSVAISAIVLAPHLRPTLRRLRTEAVAAVAVVSAAVVGGVAWTVLADTNNPAQDRFHVTVSPWPDILSQPVLWLLQSVAAFPTRGDSAPVAVYAIVLALFWALTAVAWRQAPVRARCALVLVLLASTAIPVALSLASYWSIGFAWQGRYTWPLALGFLVIAGATLDGGLRSNGRRGYVLAATFTASMAVATLVGQLGVLTNELAHSPLAHDPAWLRPPALLVVLLTLGGFALIAVAVQVGRTRPAAAVRVADEEDRATPVNLSR